MEVRAEVVNAAFTPMTIIDPKVRYIVMNSTVYAFNEREHVAERYKR